jgi:hypothetical protein
MESLSYAHTRSTMMDDGWHNASTDSVEFYEYETFDGIAVIFRHCNNRHGYLACVSHAGHHLMADAHFQTIDAAKTWVAYQILRWSSRR